MQYSNYKRTETLPVNKIFLKLELLTLILLEPNVIGFCHQYRARPDCMSMQSVQALYVQSHILISLKLIMDNFKNRRSTCPLKKFSRLRIKCHYNTIILTTLLPSMFFRHSDTNKSFNMDGHGSGPLIRYTWKYTGSIIYRSSLLLLVGGRVVKWLTHWTSNLRINSYIGSNPVSGKPLFP